MLRKNKKLTAFLHIEAVYVRKHGKMKVFLHIGCVSSASFSLYFL